MNNPVIRSAFPKMRAKGAPIPKPRPQKKLVPVEVQLFIELAARPDKASGAFHFLRSDALAKRRITVCLNSAHPLTAQALERSDSLLLAYMIAVELVGVFVLWHKNGVVTEIQRSLCNRLWPKRWGLYQVFGPLAYHLAERIIAPKLPIFADARPGLHHLLTFGLRVSDSAAQEHWGPTAQQQAKK